MLHHKDLTTIKLMSLIHEGEIVFGGNRRLKIYGTLSCKSGTRIQNWRTKLLFSWRQSLIHFGKYRLPDTTYFNQQQFLSDIMLRYAVVGDKLGLTFSMGAFINGTGPGDRRYDLQP